MELFRISVSHVNMSSASLGLSLKSSQQTAFFSTVFLPYLRPETTATSLNQKTDKRQSKTTSGWIQFICSALFKDSLPAVTLVDCICCSFAHFLLYNVRLIQTSSTIIIWGNTLISCTMKTSWKEWHPSCHSSAIYFCTTLGPGIQVDLWSIKLTQTSIQAACHTSKTTQELWEIRAQRVDQSSQFPRS